MSLRILSIIALTAAFSVAASPDATRAPASFPRAEPLTAGTVLGDATLAPYKDLFAPGDALAFKDASRKLTTGAPFRVAQGFAAAFTDERRATQRFLGGFSSLGGLLTVEGGEGQPLLLGTAPGTGLSLLPRLKSGVIAPASPDPGADAWLFSHPERVCTSGFGQQAAEVDASELGDLESLHASAEMPNAHLDALLMVASSPDPMGFALSAAGVPNDMLGLGEGDGHSGASLVAIADEDLGGVLPEGREDRLVTRLRKGGLPFEAYLAELEGLPLFATVGDTPQRLRVLLTELLPTAKAAAKACAHQFHEVREADDGLHLFGCVSPSGRPVGFGARLVGPGIMPLRLTLTYADEVGRGAELTVDNQAETMALAMTQDGAGAGPELTWSFTGKPAAMTWQTSNEAGLRASGVFEWHEDGAPKLLGRRFGGRPTGDETVWHENGAPASVTSYGLTGDVVGYRAWFPNGEMADELSTSKGVTVRKIWHPSGRLAAEMPLKNGQPEGRATFWYESGAPGIVLSYAGGAPTGEVQWFYEDAKPLFRGIFAGGEADGAHRLYRPSGELLSERLYKRGVATGRWTAYDMQGAKRREIAFADGQREGTSIIRYAGGQPILEMSFQGGQLHGDVAAYYPSGARATTCDYVKGDVVSFKRWTSQGVVAASGETEDAAQGVQAFTIFRDTGKPLLTCRTIAYETDSCDVFDENGYLLRFPAKQDLFAKASGPLTWQPDACGGEAETWSYQDMIDLRGDRIDVTFETLDACPKAEQGEALTCTLRVAGNRIDAETCTLRRSEIAH